MIGTAIGGISVVGVLVGAVIRNTFGRVIGIGLCGTISGLSRTAGRFCGIGRMLGITAILCASLGSILRSLGGLVLIRHIIASVSAISVSRTARNR